MLSLKPENVRCIYVEGAGCYGRNGADDCSPRRRSSPGKSASRCDCNGCGRTSTAGIRRVRRTVLDYRAGIDDQGQITAWESDIFLAERPMKRSGVTLLPAALANLPKFGPSGPGTYNLGLGIPYALPNNKLTAHWLLDTPCLRRGFARRRQHKTPSATRASSTRSQLPRARPVRHPLPPAQGHARARVAPAPAGPSPNGSRAGRGRAYGSQSAWPRREYASTSCVRTYVGVVADVTVDRTTGAIHVDRVFVVHDCGQIINPDGLRNQIEGNVVQTVSRSIVEKVTFSRSAVTSLDWAAIRSLISRRARGRHRSRRPTERGAVGRRGTHVVCDSVRDRQRGIRRHRRAG